MSGRASEAKLKKREATSVRPLILRCQAAAFKMGFARAFSMLILEDALRSRH
jgi:hypothetical protein